MKSATAISDPDRFCAVSVLERAIEEGRIPHAVLLYGPDLSLLEDAASHLAAQILGPELPVRSHPDLFSLRPVNKMRQINVEHTRALIRDIQHTSNQGGYKVTVIHEADRMNKAASNAFLKTLEEPPAQTVLFLISTRPYDLLDTVRSRCFKMKVPGRVESLDLGEWKTWLSEYQDWLKLLSGGVRSQEESGRVVLMAYNLIYHFGIILKEESAISWKTEKEQLPENLSDEAKSALEAGHFKGLRLRFWQDIEQATRDFVNSFSLNHESVFCLSRAIVILEEAAAMMAYNLTEQVALEHFMLRSMRLWVRLGR